MGPRSPCDGTVAAGKQQMIELNTPEDHDPCSAPWHDADTVPLEEDRATIVPLDGKRA
jgi:hypothetical protein